jgi:hypothetical protein
MDQGRFETTDGSDKEDEKRGPLKGTGNPGMEMPGVSRFEKELFCAKLVIKRRRCPGKDSIETGSQPGNQLRRYRLGMVGANLHFQLN